MQYVLTGLVMNRMVDRQSEEWPRWVLLLGLGGVVGNFIFSLTDHAQNGFYHPTEGRIRFAGQDRTRLAPYDVAALGIARTFQNVALFKGMTVLDNIMTGRILKMKGKSYRAHRAQMAEAARQAGK